MLAAGEADQRVRNLRGVWLFSREGADDCVTDVTKVRQGRRGRTILLLLRGTV